MAAGGYPTILEGIVGPWMLDLVSAEAETRDVELHYVVLRPSLETCLARATARTGDERVQGHPALTDEAPIRTMWRAFAHLDGYEQHVIDTTELDLEETAGRVWSVLKR